LRPALWLEALLFVFRSFSSVLMTGLVVGLALVPATSDAFRKRGATMLTEAMMPDSIKNAELMPLADARSMMERLDARTLWDPSQGIDMLPAEGISFLDNTQGQVEQAYVHRSEGGEAIVMLRDEQVNWLKPFLSVEGGGPDQIAAVSIQEQPLRPGLSLEQARIAASYPRLVTLHGDDLLLLTNDLLPNNVIGADGVLRYEVSWHVKAQYTDLSRIIGEVPGDFRVFIDTADADSKRFGAPTVYVMPWSELGFDEGRDGYKLSYGLLNVPGSSEKKWFNFAKRIEFTL
jgi:hypothetical protein